MFIIRTENRFLHLREIAHIANKLEPYLSLPLLKKKISPALCYLRKQSPGLVTSYVVGNYHHNTFWGFPEWLETDGTITNAHLYDESQLSKIQPRA